jgi:predicted nucleic acid-binding protein
MPDTFVLDCSVAAKWVLPEPDRTPALDLFQRYASGEVLLIAPDLLLAEFASLVAKRHRRKQISAEQARTAFSLMTKCAPRLFDTGPQLSRALDLSLRRQLSLWDCVYLALALEYDCPVITADLRLFRAAKNGPAATLPLISLFC